MAFDNAPALGGHRNACKRRFCREDGFNMMFDSHRQEQQQQKEHLSNSAGRVNRPTHTHTHTHTHTYRHTQARGSNLSYVI
jgi:succinylglutamate desuccinylase